MMPSKMKKNIPDSTNLDNKSKKLDSLKTGKDKHIVKLKDLHKHDKLILCHVNSA